MPKCLLESRTHQGFVPYYSESKDKTILFDIMTESLVYANKKCRMTIQNKQINKELRYNSL